MNIYARKQRWKLGLAAAAFVIVIVSFWYSHNLVRDISENEKKKVELWASAVQKKASLVKFTKELFEEIKTGERRKAELFGEALKELTTGSDLGQNAGISFILKVLRTIQPYLSSSRMKATGYLRRGTSTPFSPLIPPTWRSS